ncbi:MAG: hypothetical protein A2V21_304065 [Deltaproteobacteria bacterium GWC2_55_46]|nr:MAG: hypothetical protein A2Z79_12995 [Deltaproteobacteria bacterium GWA2_55_82]OIJ73512.1 MAG: hypothetical protein A2V21_304065 [Deltaproteobacteria bacterium GWC2_55_46]
MRTINSKKPAGIWLAALFLPLVAAVTFGCSGGDTGSKPESLNAKTTASKPEKIDLEQGKEIYFKYCHFCHGQKGYGDGPVGIALSPHPANFVEDRKRMDKTDEEMFRSITAGIHKDIGGEAMSMPRWQEILTDAERWNVLAYIRFLEQEGLKAAEAKELTPSGRTGKTDAR